jgi:hypothetical protein
MQNSEHGILAASWARAMHLSGGHPRCENWPSKFEKQKGKNEKQTKQTKQKN